MMTADFDVQAAYRFFAAECFNRAWGLIDKPKRTAEETEQMLALAWASNWHWSQRPDCTDTNRSIGLWQLARVYAEAGRAEEARRYAELCLQVSQSGAVEPVYLGYAYEALARAASCARNKDEAHAHLKRAHEIAQNVEDQEDRLQLLTDLAAFPPS